MGLREIIRDRIPGWKKEVLLRNKCVGQYIEGVYKRVRKTVPPTGNQIEAYKLVSKIVNSSDLGHSFNWSLDTKKDYEFWSKVNYEIMQAWYQLQ